MAEMPVRKAHLKMFDIILPFAMFLPHRQVIVYLYAALFEACTSL